MMTDPIADMLTRIRNAIAIERSHVEMPTSKVKVSIADVLKREGYIWDYEVVEVEGQPRAELHLTLKYGPNGERVVQHIQRASKPGRRRYQSVRGMQPVLGGLGIEILSTSKGMLSSREAREQNVGGEVVATIW